MCIVFERRRAQEQDVPAQARDRCDRSPGRVARVAGRAAESLGLVHDEEIDACAHGQVGQLRPLRQHLQGDHGTTMNVEGVEVGTEITCHVGEALRIEQREHLVILAPQLTEPLNGQDIWCDDETALDLPGVDQPIQDERGFDRFPEAHFVGEQPAHGIAGRRAFRDVQLVRKQADASAEERTQTIGLAERQKAQNVQPGDEVLDVVEIAQREPLEQRALELDRPQGVGRRRAPVRQLERSVRESPDNRRVFLRVDDADRPPGTEIDRLQRIRVRGEPQRRARSRERRRGAPAPRARSRVRCPAPD